MDATENTAPQDAVDDNAGWAEGADEAIAEVIEQPDQPDPQQTESPAKPDVAEPANDAQPQDAKPDTETKDAEDTPDVWEGATESQRMEYQQLSSRYKDLEHKAKSFEGRVPGLQRENDELKRKLQDVEQVKKPETTDEDFDFGEDWEALKEDYPAVAKAMEQQLAVSKALTAKLQAAPQAPAVGWQDALDASRPGWRDDVEGDTPKAKAFQSWLNGQPETVQAIANHPEPWAAIQTYDLYKGHVSGKKKHADDISVARRQRLETAETERGKPSQRPTESDPNTGWAA